jgi:hypothetical protein
MPTTEFLLLILQNSGTAVRNVLRVLLNCLDRRTEGDL